ncbi:CidA/LrgA family holin-like protein [Paenibacillus sp. Leaf72]|uniref:CidA/LrgA family holin-like protein n=1 Tax=Paenibacillus sp. Leaf72 TaxID=1736234 RepID=UPI0006F84945|nr:CidA/LrgA family holin-like protein [Paenibacillus sp. Leaf72]KQO13754.1 holin [Paenibacillus sp. Leaf72]
MIRKITLGLVQVLFFVALFWTLNGLSVWLHLKVPGSILGLILVFLLLHFRVIKVEWVELGSKWLVAEMLLFFIPPAAGMMQFKDLLLGSGVQILLVIVVTSILVMVCAGVMTQFVASRKERGRG